MGGQEYRSLETKNTTKNERNRYRGRPNDVFRDSKTTKEKSLIMDHIKLVLYSFL
jgi:hypothetical protein